MPFTPQAEEIRERTPRCVVPPGVVNSAEPRPLRDANVMRAVRWAAVTVGSWMLVAALFGWHEHDLAVRRGEPSQYAVRLMEAAAPMLVWALFTPFLLYVGHVFPLRKPHTIRNAVLVFAAAAAVALLRCAADVMLMVTHRGVIASAAALVHVHLIFALIILGVANFIRLEREDTNRRHSRAMSEADEAEAVLRQLRADLNPHFLFNTLNAVATLLHVNPGKAVRMLDKLGDFLRNAIATEQAREVPLADELELVSRYFDLQTMRFGEKLTTVIHVADPMLRNAAVPPLLVQPLIENAIVHGIMQSRDGGCVAVLVDRHDDAQGTWLRIDVRDDGPGFDSSSGGARARVGLANVASRLASMYGPAHALSFLHTGEGFVARLLIPLTMKA